MPETTPATKTYTAHPSKTQPDIVGSIYTSINQGAFAVILFAGVVTIGVSRSMSKFLSSDFSKAILATVRQINENQVHVEQLVEISNRQHTLTETIGETVVSLQSIVESGAALDTKRHTELINALTTLQKSLREVPK